MENSSEFIREHVWRHFELHANQRLTIFNYFLLLTGAAATGLAATIQGSSALSLIGAALGFLLMLVSFVFWKLDQRCAFLIKHAEIALIGLEESFQKDATRIFTEELKLTAEKTKGHFAISQWTFGKSFRFVFFTMSLVGLSGAAISLLRHVKVLSW